MNEIKQRKEENKRNFEEPNRFFKENQKAKYQPDERDQDFDTYRSYYRAGKYQPKQCRYAALSFNQN